MVISVKKAEFLRKIIGLIGQERIEPIYFQTRWGIHTFGVKKPIDVVILDDKNYVVKIKQNLQPNRIFLWNPKYKNVLELPEGTIANEKIKEGEKITI